MINNKFIDNLRNFPNHGMARGDSEYAPGRTPAGNGDSSPAPNSGDTAGQPEVTPLTPAVLARIQQETIANYEQQMSNKVAIANRGKTFQSFDLSPYNGDIIQASQESVTAGVWSDNLTSLTTYYSSSDLTSAQTAYYVNVYQKDPTDTGSAIQYALAYGNSLGSGSSTDGSLNDSPSRAIYGQYQQLLLEPTVTKFSTVTSGSTDSIYVVNFQRNRTKEKLDAGNWEMPLSTISASRASNATGSVVLSASADTFTFIDDSSISSGSNGSSGKVYNIVSGSISNGVYNSSAPYYYGTAYMDHSTLVFDGDILDANLGFTTNTGSDSNGSNHYAMFHSISGSYPLATNAFQARNMEKVSSTFYFVRVKNGDFNYSNNPSYITGSNGDISQAGFIGDPKSYITTIGLYNANRELLAVAKLSKPLLKTKKSEVTVRVKLEY